MGGCAGGWVGGLAGERVKGGLLVSWELVGKTVRGEEMGTWSGEGE